MCMCIRAGFLALLGYCCLVHQVDDFLPYWLVFSPEEVPVFVASSARGASYCSGGCDGYTLFLLDIHAGCVL